MEEINTNMKHDEDEFLIPCYTTFRVRLLPLVRIHWSKDTKICPKCTLKSKLHDALIKKQFAAYRDCKQSLIDSKNDEKVLIVQDFTQVVVQDTFYQDMVLCTYSYSEDADTKLESSYYHFFGQSAAAKMT